jgi:biotin-(acetyl-CoA carboxylase) ligase
LRYRKAQPENRLSPDGTLSSEGKAASASRLLPQSRLVSESRSATQTRLPVAEAIASEIRTRFLGRNIVYSPETGSTNEDAKALGLHHPEGTVFLAAAQTGGKGRLGRTWSSPPGGIYMSLVLRPTTAPESIPLVSIVAGYSVAMAIREVTGLPAMLKWPNDVLVEGRKVCGILCEMVLPPASPATPAAASEPIAASSPPSSPAPSAPPSSPASSAPPSSPASSRPQAEHALGASGPRPHLQRPLLVVGIGINACIDPSSLSPEVRGTACSLSSLLGDEINPSILAAAVLNRFEPAYLQFLDDGLAPFLQGIREVAAFLGEPVAIGNRSKGDMGLVQGIFREIDAQGRAIVELPGGERMAFSAGDLSLRRT